MNEKELFVKWRENPLLCCETNAEIFQMTEMLSAKEDAGYDIHSFIADKVKKHISDWLHCIADHIASGHSPYIYDADFPERKPDAPASLETMESFSVTFSHPWGG